MLIHPEKSCLLVIDIQERLLPAVQQPEQVERAIIDLIEVAKILKVPQLYSEQYPKGLGGTQPSVLDALEGEGTRLEKMTFSCAADRACNEAINALKANQIVICGMESHVCVLQTAIELKQQARQVFVVADAVSSRSDESKDLALERMRQAGIHIVNREMVIFEWLQRAGTDAFKQISKNYLR